MEPLYIINLMITSKIDPDKTITDVVMFDLASNLQLVGDLVKFYYPKLAVMRGVEHTFYLFFNDVSIF